MFSFSATKTTDTKNEGSLVPVETEERIPEE